MYNLNLAILDMLDLNRKTNLCSSFCRENPLTNEGKRKQMLKMLCVVLIPLMVLTAMTANTLAKSVQSHMTSANIRNTILFGTEVGELLLALQRERDMSTLYVSNLGPKTKQYLLQRYPETDERLANLTAWPVDRSETRFQFQSKDVFISYLNQHRYELDLQQPTTKDEILFYTEAIDVFITWIFKAISEAQSGAIWRSLVAYQEVVVTSEYIGRERGVGVIFYSRGQFDTRDDYLLFADSHDVANSTFSSAKRYSDIVTEVYDGQSKGNGTFLTTVQKMRTEILSNNYTLTPSVENANWWFNNMSKYQDAIIGVTKNKIVSHIISILVKQSDRDVRTIVVIAGVFCIICIIAILVVTLVYSLTSRIQEYSVSIANRTKSLDRERRRTDMLLHQMLPKSVADRLTRNEEVKAEFFHEATVFLSDIVGFTKICSIISPLQVVNMLNNVYSCFDERINSYDVYKVETVGDAYLVVSGVPHRNGKNHALEVSKLGLDLLSLIDQIELSFLPDVKLKLRIGCHSGKKSIMSSNLFSFTGLYLNIKGELSNWVWPVVAGIVGAKMPKYCLFGETITVASLMEKLGKAGRIHISQSMYELLSEVGGLNLRENTDENVKLDMAILEMLDLRQSRNRKSHHKRRKKKTDDKNVRCCIGAPDGFNGDDSKHIGIATKRRFDSANIRKTILFGTEVGDLLRALQRERDMSTLYVSNLGPKSKQFLLQRYPETDERLANLSAWPVAPSEHRFQFKTKDIFISYLNQHRYELDLKQPTTKEEILFYTEAIDVFITWIYEAISEAQSGAIWRSLVAYQEIVVTSEYIGRERGVGVIFYAKGQFDTRDDYLLFSESQDVANSTYSSAKRYSNIVFEVYDGQFKGNESFLKTVQKMRTEIRSDSFLTPSVERANWWFNNMSKYQDVISVTQNEIVSKIISILWKQSDSDVKTIVIIAGIFCGICIISILVVYAVYSLTSQIQTYSVSIANRTKELNKEKRRTEALLHQMLPKSVANRLKRNEVVDAELFEEASVCFCDIVGFTQISSLSSPLQVVDMLNSLYSCFDERINCYDVYKVETIGDGYMVVSGVPRRNGKRHASEIASLALDMLKHIHKLEIPHLPGTKFKLRIGCHSGPVVAGVVGVKMPKYCLFGETVTVASKLEALGRGNPLTDEGKRKHMLKMLAVVLIPLMVLTAMTANTLIIAVKGYINSANIRRTIFFGTEVGTLLQSLQKERDMSTLYVSNLGPKTKQYLLQRYPETDERLANLSAWPVTSGENRPQFQSKEIFISHLNRHRYELDLIQTTTKEELLFYTEAIDVFITWIYEAISEAQSGVIWRSLVAYQEVVVTSEYIGRERGVGVIFYAKGQFETRDDYLLFAESQDVANSTYSSARRYSDIVTEVYDDQFRDNDTFLRIISDMRKEIRSSLASLGPSVERANWWFSNMSLYQDVVRVTQQKIGAEIIPILKKQSDTDLKTIVLIGGIFCGVCIISPLVVFAVYSMTSQIQKTRALSKEKKRTDKLLFLLLPISLSKRVKKNEHVDAELFTETTIFFSDIVGFPYILSVSSPVQVVDMLNGLHSLFEEKIGCFSVYQVETIGNTYMIVSGIPCLNGKKHASEIASMALELLESVNQIEISHLPGTSLRLRIGIHSGPVVAGVVGVKMQKYCLFGETVTIAAKMEKLGKAGRIHVSETTHDLLRVLNGFKMEENIGNERIKSDQDLLTCFRGIVRTYWLIPKDGLDRRTKNPITDEGKRKQMTKMLGFVLVPLMVLTAMTANTLVIATKRRFDSANIRKTILFGTEVGDLLRALQRERDMSTLYVSNLGPKTKQFLLQRYPETDERLANLSAWPVAPSENRFQFQTKDIFISYLNQHRYELDLKQPTTKEEILFYTEAIDVFITWIYEAISEAQSGAIWRSLVAYQEIVVTSEYIGRERGVGVIFYAKGQFDTRDDYLLFSESQDVANSTYSSAKRYSNIVTEVYDGQFKGNETFLKIVQKMRTEIRSDSFLTPSVERANWWFNNMSKYQDVISVTQNEIVSKIISILWKQSDSDVKTIVIIAGIFCGICIISILVVYAVYSLTSQIQTYSVSIANRLNSHSIFRTKELNKEKRRTEALLHQMLPKSVADRLKKNEVVVAELFEEASVCLCDIVGFTQISSLSSPLQVVDMLNSLYSCFDERINCYDVYKVETIGDGYMVVSGVPRRNGKRHASEIASLALDMLKHIHRLEIPHLPGTKFKLRIGCHSGPVVAGVVGVKMPKYCLFGETVTVASKLEALGRAGKVHTSEVTRNLLASLGGFQMEENLDLTVKIFTFSWYLAFFVNTILSE
ncbi:hypothetical protein KUTeg_003468 [Tegillarca granosa]|uniref:guanylate cyclase n=1 Tax=Tegillarca granosa TaxID=220873 RepID=A0ABQ9FP22_TEGGR|nr:hypothetical protein KUTeg_003468 [Tegillarca granosa]